MSVHVNSMSFNVVDDPTVVAGAPAILQRTGLRVEPATPVSVVTWFVRADQDVTAAQWQEFAQWIGPLLDPDTPVQAVQVDTDMVQMAQTVTVRDDSTVVIEPVIPTDPWN